MEDKEKQTKRKERGIGRSRQIEKILTERRLRNIEEQTEREKKKWLEMSSQSID